MGGPYGKIDRLYAANTDGSELYCLADDKMVSHYFWLDNKHLIAWARKEPVGDRDLILKDNSNDFKIIGEDILDSYGDGHPHVHPGEKWIITDTYPKKARIRELLLYNLKTNRHLVIGVRIRDCDSNY